MNDDAFFRNINILIGGLGLIGGSVAKALKENGARLWAYDSDEKTLNQAQADGLIETSYTAFSEDMPAFDMAICCLPPCAAAGFYADVKPYLKDGGVFCELGGLKTHMIETLEGLLHNCHALLSLHPMAGSEKAGYQYSDARLFEGSLLILTPTTKTNDKARRYANMLKIAMGSSDMRELSASEHDEIIAHISHIPHVAALAVKAMNHNNGYERFAGGSYHAITRVADINAALWAGLFIDNKQNLLKSISELKQNICTLETAVENGDMQSLETLLGHISGKKEDI